MEFSQQSVVGIIGGGAMGNGIAQVAATYGHQVYVYDNNAMSLDKAKSSMTSTIEMLIDKGKMSRLEGDAILSRLHYTNKIEDLNKASLVIEAVVEKMEIKKEIFRMVENIVDANCLLASNTSSLSITEIASECSLPNRVLGIHFFNPAPIMKLVEVAPALQSDMSLVTAAQQWMIAWGKTAVMTKDTPGFIVNRIARPFYSEALRIFDEGLATKEEIDAAMTQHAGFRMGPFTLMDFIGNDVNFNVTDCTYKAFYEEPRYKPSLTQKNLVLAKWFGKKSGRGFYNYQDGLVPVIPEISAEQAEPIIKRILAMLMNEAHDALYYRVASAEDIDLAMTLGVNYPKGLLAWSDQWGHQTVVKIIDDLYSLYHEDRYRVSMGLRRK